MPSCSGERYAAACRAYLNSLDPGSDRAYEDHDRRHLMPTYWLLTGTLPEGSPMDDYAQLLEAHDYARAFGIWQDRIVREPSVWMRGFSLVLAREAFRNFILAYCDDIVEVVASRFG